MDPQNITASTYQIDWRTILLKIDAVLHLCLAKLCLPKLQMSFGSTAAGIKRPSEGKILEAEAVTMIHL